MALWAYYEKRVRITWCFDRFVTTCWSWSYQSCQLLLLPWGCLYIYSVADFGDSEACLLVFRPSMGVTNFTKIRTGFSVDFFCKRCSFCGIVQRRGSYCCLTPFVVPLSWKYFRWCHRTLRAPTRTRGEFNQERSENSLQKDRYFIPCIENILVKFILTISGSWVHTFPKLTLLICLRRVTQYVKNHRWGLSGKENYVNDGMRWRSTVLILPAMNVILRLATASFNIFIFQ